jgi:dipeptidyl aminopeptidase/acylaminoacyl peptidase
MRISRGFLSALSVALISCMLGGRAPAADLRALAVSDSIQMTVVTDPNKALSEFYPAEVKVSDDAHWAFIVVKRGNLATGNNDFELLLYDVGQVSRELDKPQLPSARTLVRFSSSSNRDAIARARWLPDSKTIAFIGEHPGEVPQLYTVHATGGAPKQLTFSVTPVTDFDLNDASDRFIYSTETPVDWKARNAHGYQVGLEPVFDAVARGTFSINSRIEYYVGSKSSKAVRRVDCDTGLRRQDALGMWISPKGTWAVVPRHPLNPPASWWKGYTLIANNEHLRGTNSPETKWFSVSRAAVFVQYMLVDMKSGAARALLDAPTGLYFGGQIIRAHWLADESRVILANTFLPLTPSVEPDELEARRKSPAIAELNLATSVLTRIASVVPNGNGATAETRLFYDSRYSDRDGLVVTWKPSTGTLQKTVYQYLDRRWQERNPELRPPSGISFSIVQGLNDPPELMATDAAGRSKVLSDLNPQLRTVNLGHMELFQWSDNAHRIWVGGLLKPTNYTPGRRYPLVMLTHGFSASEFSMDGPYGSAAGYAARVMANRGLMVLEVKDSVGVLGVREELDTQVEGYRAAIQELDREQLIDPARVGIHGWSRSGFYVQQALVFSGIPFAAASVSDPSELGAATYANFFGMPYPGMVDNERMLGASPWGDESAKLWAERDPTFHLDRVHTPLHIEVYQEGLLWWDMYANLRRHQKPVEYWYFPDATHTMLKPWERLTSQETAVDWYDFWLNAHEDPDPKKAAQYVRWRELRKLDVTDRDRLVSPQVPPSTAH